MSMSLGIGLGLTHGRRRASAPAHEQILTLAAADGWTAVYDPGNPATRTLRQETELHFTALADGLGASGTLEQASGAAQPYLVPAAFGRLDGMQFSGGQTLNDTSAFSVAAPWSVVAVGKFDTTASERALFQLIAGTSFTNTTPIFLWVSSGQWSLYDGSAIRLGGAADTSPHVFTLGCDGVDAFLYVDGALKIQTAYNVSAGSLKLGARGALSFLLGRAGPWALTSVAPSGPSITAMQDLVHGLTGISKA